MKKYLGIILILFFASFLRLYKLDQVPVSLFGDELDVGYQAYSILKTGKDYSGNFMPLHCQSLAEWRTPLYLYSAVPTVAIFGVSPLGVRLPAAIFGIGGILVFYFLVKETRLNYLKIQNSKLEIVASLLLALSPWHIQYSRAGFEVTQLLFFLLLGLWLFFKGLKNGKWLPFSMASFGLTPWVYSTAKLFTPLLLLFLSLIWRKQILEIPKKYLLFAFLALTIVAGPIAYSTLFGGGTQRFNYISVFSDPTVEPEIGTARQNDARVRGEKGEGLTPSAVDKFFHNKFVFWGENILNNYYQSLSVDFLFSEGDPNLRHSIKNMGQFYKIEIILLLIGTVLFFSKSRSKKIKALIAFWILVGIIPAAITRDGGRHATRLILILPPLIFLISFGFMNLLLVTNQKLRIFLISSYLFLFVLSFLFYQHQFWLHNPWESERWWHSGWGESISAVKSVEKDYETVVISSADEPPWIFFAGWYMFPPDKWHQGYPMQKKELNGFGEMSYIDKFYFGSPSGHGLYEWGQILDDKTLYLASAKEVRVNLIMEPERTPKDLVLIKSIAYPSGEPAFYLFRGNKKGS